MNEDLEAQRNELTKKYEGEEAIFKKTISQLESDNRALEDHVGSLTAHISALKNENQNLSNLKTRLENKLESIQGANDKKGAYSEELEKQNAAQLEQIKGKFTHLTQSILILILLFSSELNANMTEAYNSLKTMEEKFDRLQKETRAKLERQNQLELNLKKEQGKNDRL